MTRTIAAITLAAILATVAGANALQAWHRAQDTLRRVEFKRNKAAIANPQAWLEFQTRYRTP